jgi:hypothetical protein
MTRAYKPACGCSYCVLFRLDDVAYHPEQQRLAFGYHRASSERWRASLGALFLRKTAPRRRGRLDARDGLRSRDVVLGTSDAVALHSVRPKAGLGLGRALFVGKAV